MDVSQGSGAAQMGENDGPARVDAATLPKGLSRGAWGIVVSVAEDLAILAQFAFGKEYGAGQTGKTLPLFPVRLASDGGL